MPIFIVGMPRSGTTLLERILGNHSQVTPAGELADFSRQWRWVADRHGHKLLDQAMVRTAGEIDFAEVGRRYLEQTQWRACGRPYYVDKLPPNFMLAGFIRPGIAAGENRAHEPRSAGSVLLQLPRAVWRCLCLQL
jgi:hypothetical protein